MSGRTLIIGLLTLGIGSLLVLLTYIWRRMVDALPQPRRVRILLIWIALWAALPFLESVYWNYAFQEHTTPVQQFISNLPMFSTLLVGWCWSMVRTAAAERRRSV